MRRIIPVLALLVGALALNGLAAQDGVKADIRGSISSIKMLDKNSAGILASALIEGKKEATTGYDKASVKITAKTKIEKMVGKDRRVATLEDLKKGAKVQANFVGPVAESYPVQATAGDILILEEAK